MLFSMTNVKFILASISNASPFWYVNHTSMVLNSDLIISKKIWFVNF